MNPELIAAISAIIVAIASVLKSYSTSNTIKCLKDLQDQQIMIEQLKRTVNELDNTIYKLTKLLERKDS